MTQSGWESYYLYISFSDAYSKGDKLYADMYVDMGGYGASYPAYAYYITFGDKNLTGINSVEAAAFVAASFSLTITPALAQYPCKSRKLFRDAY